MLIFKKFFHAIPEKLYRFTIILIRIRRKFGQNLKEKNKKERRSKFLLNLKAAIKELIDKQKMKKKK